MKLSLTDILCTRCGLCCDGTLFADVELAPRDDTGALEVLGLEVEDDDDRPGRKLLLQPCAALRGRRCGIYPYRPQCCRTFECQLLSSVRQGTLELNTAAAQLTKVLAAIAAVQERLTSLAPVPESLPIRERVAAVLEATEGDTRPAMVRTRGELEAAMTALGKQLNKTFLGE